MSVLASIRNNFLGLAFLTVLLLPTVVHADYDVPGDTAKNINNLKEGSSITINTPSQAAPGGGSIPASTYYYNLYNSAQGTVSTTDSDVVTLRGKLKLGGSNLDTTAITKDNLYRVNTEKTSLFYYKNPGDGKEYLLAAATDDGHLYVLKQPVVKETGTKTSLDTTTDNGVLNTIDKAEGLPFRTTVDAKNLKYDVDQEKIGADKEVDVARANLDAAQKARDEYKGSNQNGEIQAYDTAIAQARAVLEGAEAKQKALAETQKKINDQMRATQPQQELGCGVTNFYKIDCILYFISIPANVGFKLVSFFTYVIGTLFDYSLELSINSAELIKKLGVVEITWSFIRDVLNMSFIFILLWVAIQILLDSKDNYNARKVLTRVILVAIGINFSLFGAKLMVDGSNIVSLKIYESMKATSASGEISSISERVMNAVGLTTLYSFSDIFSTETVKSCSTVPAAIITISVMGSIFLLIICLALGLAAILFLIRMVNIIFLFIKSPFWVWGYVLPGNKRIEKFKDEWWKEMMHVLTFPILYLFWMLVALIVFEKLGSVKSDISGSKTQGVAGPSLLDLICQPSTGGSITTTISLVAIFAIVIIFLMKAIEHGIKHATSGAEGSFGGDLAAAAGKRIGGYQTMLTKGLRDKALGAAKTASVGAAKLPLRAVTGVTGGVTSKIRGNGFWNGTKDGFLNPSINTKETLATITGRAAMLTGSKILADRAVKMNDATAKSRKEVEAARVKNAKDKETALQAIAGKEYKIETQEQWEKKNGAIGADATKAAKYEDYVKKMIEKRADVALRRGIMQQTDDKGNKNMDLIASKVIANSFDSNGNYKIKVSNHEMEKGFGDILKDYSGTGKYAEKFGISKKGLWKPFRTKKGAAAVKAAEEAFKANMGKYSSEQAGKDLGELIKKTEQQLAHMPDDSTLSKFEEELGKAQLDHAAMAALITKEAEKSCKEVRDLVKLQKKLSGAGAGTPKADELKEKIEDQIEKIRTTREKKTKEVIKRTEEREKKEKARKDKEAKESK